MSAFPQVRAVANPTGCNIGALRFIACHCAGKDEYIGSARAKGFDLRRLPHIFCAPYELCSMYSMDIASSPVTRHCLDAIQLYTSDMILPDI